MTLLRKKTKNTAYFFKKSSKLCQKRKRKNPVNTHRKKYGTGKLDSGKENFGNTFSRVRKQFLLFKTGVSIGYASFYRSLLSYPLTIKLPCGS